MEGDKPNFEHVEDEVLLDHEMRMPRKQVDIEV